MDKIDVPDESVFDEFIETEKKRGTNFVTVVGGEPSLAIDRIKKLYDEFKINVATNGLLRIPIEGLEDLPIGISVWGDPRTDSRLRGNGKQNLFEKALENYAGDDRAFWYYTVAPGHAGEVEAVVRTCVENGNSVLFNYYSDLAGLGKDMDYKRGFEKVREEIDRMVRLFPDKIMTTPYFNKVVSQGELMGEKWGYDVCTNLSTNYEKNTERFRNGKPFNAHFRSYNADFKTTRRCCTGIDRSCESCYDTWEHFSWVMINLRKHLSSKKDFANWLTTTYLFYYINRLTGPAAPTLSEVHSYIRNEGQEDSPDEKPVLQTAG